SGRDVTMSGLLYALALFGCADDASMCERLTDQAKTYNSRVSCEMAATFEMQSELVRRADYPTVIGQCMTKGQWVKLGDEPINLAEKAIRLPAANRTRMANRARDK